MDFRRWRGVSGRLFLVSVYPIERCPDYVDAVVLAVDPSGDQGPVCVWIGDTGAGGEGLRTVLAAAMAAGAREAHVHLLAGDGAARADVIRELSQRH